MDDLAYLDAFIGARLLSPAARHQGCAVFVAGQAHRVGVVSRVAAEEGWGYAQGGDERLHDGAISVIGGTQLGGEGNPDARNRADEVELVAVNPSVPP